jgi:hypothetical protein
MAWKPRRVGTSWLGVGPNQISEMAPGGARSGCHSQNRSVRPYRCLDGGLRVGRRGPRYRRGLTRQHSRRERCHPCLPEQGDRRGTYRRPVEVRRSWHLYHQRALAETPVSRSQTGPQGEQGPQGPSGSAHTGTIYGATQNVGSFDPVAGQADFYEYCPTGQVAISGSARYLDSGGPGPFPLVAQIAETGSFSNAMEIYSDPYADTFADPGGSINYQIACGNLSP